MSEREKALHLLEAIDDEKMVYVVGILENLTGFANASTLTSSVQTEAENTSHNNSLLC